MITKLGFEPTLPVPGHSNLGGLRSETPLRYTVPAVKVTPQIGKRPAGRMPIRAIPAASPEQPTTSRPLGRLVEAPADRHARVYPRHVAVGALTPFHGVPVYLPDGRLGGAPDPPDPLLAALRLPSPGSRFTQGSSFKDLRAAISYASRAAKPKVRLLAGIGGADMATAVRVVPDTPSGIREAIYDLRPKAWRGNLNQNRTVPWSIGAALAAGRMSGVSFAPAPSPSSLPASPIESNASQISAIVSAGPGIGVPADQPANPEGGPTETGSPNSLLALAAVVLVAVMVLRS